MSKTKNTTRIPLANFRGIDRRVGPLTGPYEILRTADRIELSGQKLLCSRGTAQTTMARLNSNNACNRLGFGFVYGDRYATLASTSSDIQAAFDVKPLWTDTGTESDNQSAPSQVSSAYGNTHPVSFASFKRQVYYANGFHPTKVWDGVGSANNAGIAAPSNTLSVTATTGSNATDGIHLVRYRYQNTRTGYVSAPSNTASVDIDGTGANRAYSVPVYASSNGQVDRIVIEITEAGGTQFYIANNAANANATITIDSSDLTISAAANLLPWPEDDSVQLHSAPPVRKLLLSHRERMFTAGSIIHTTGTVTVAANATVTGSGTGIGVAQSAIFSDGYYFHVVGDTVDYAISSTASETITLASSYAGTPGSGKSYEIYSKKADTLAYSLAGYVESFPEYNEIEILQQTADNVQALVSHGSDILIIGRHSMERFGYNQDPSSDGQIYPIPGNRGALNSACAHTVDMFKVFGMDRQGMWMFEGSAPQAISLPISELWSNVNLKYYSLFHVSYHPASRSVRFWVVYGSATTTTTYFEYFIDTATWAGPVTLPYAVTATVNIVDKNGNQYCLMIDSTSRLHADGIRDLMDVYPSTTATVKVSVVTSSTQFSVTTENGGTASMKADQAKLSGAPVYNMTTGESAYCDGGTNQSATVLTIASAFTTTPVVGDVLQIGLIPTTIKTRPIVIGNIFDVSQAVFLHVYFEPTSSTEYMWIRLYKDRASSAFTSYETITDGSVIFTASSQWIKVDMSDVTGKVSIPIGYGDFWRTLEVEIVVRYSGHNFKLEGLELEGSSISEVG